MNTQRRNTQRRHYSVIIFGAIAALLVVGIFVALYAGGGGGGGGIYGAGSSMKGMQMASSSRGQQSAPVATTNVGIRNFGFTPAAITVKVGSTVVWTNDDSVDHTVTFDGNAISSANLGKNDTFSHTFTVPGTYNYICTIHPFMHGSVIVSG